MTRKHPSIERIIATNAEYARVLTRAVNHSEHFRKNVFNIISVHEMCRICALTGHPDNFRLFFALARKTEPMHSAGVSAEMRDAALAGMLDNIARTCIRSGETDCVRVACVRRQLTQTDVASLAKICEVSPRPDMADAMSDAHVKMTCTHMMRLFRRMCALKNEQRRDNLAAFLVRALQRSLFYKSASGTAGCKRKAGITPSLYVQSSKLYPCFYQLLERYVSIVILHPAHPRAYYRHSRCTGYRLRYFLQYQDKCMINLFLNIDRPRATRILTDTYQGDMYITYQLVARATSHRDIIAYLDVGHTAKRTYPKNLYDALRAIITRKTLALEESRVDAFAAICEHYKTTAAYLSRRRLLDTSCALKRWNICEYMLTSHIHSDQIICPRAQYPTKRLFARTSLRGRVFFDGVCPLYKCYAKSSGQFACCEKHTPSTIRALACIPALSIDSIMIIVSM